MLLADEVLPLIRTRTDLHRWSAANAHGKQMHDGVDLLESAIPSVSAAEAYSVTHKALASAVKVIARADDSSGIIGDACRRLLALHPSVAAAAGVPAGKLVDWMMTFQFDGDVDYFELDPVAYAPALGEMGMAAYRARLDEVRATLPPQPADMKWFSGTHSHERWILDWNDRRLAILDHDVDAIIRTHARDRGVAAWFKDTAKALEEVGEFDLAIDWARQATEFDRGHQSLTASDTWCNLLSQHRPAQLVAARLAVFQRWPSSSTAARLHAAAGETWPELRDQVTTTLSAHPREAVLFALLTLKDTPLVWQLAHSLHLRDADVWDRVVASYARIDPLAVLPIHRELVEQELVEAGAAHYKRAAKRLSLMRRLAQGSAAASEVDALITGLREQHRRRPRLLQEFDRARLP
ncbi:MAG: hypothetical protein Q4P15_05170 [Propionibacteriaceae bacterium]|nr:hypothetical protein [Propionibacteriaceae bacterium]